MTTPLTKAQLAERYSDEAWRNKLMRLIDLTAVLTNCVLAKGYKIPEALTSALAFTDYGEGIRNHLIVKQKVGVKEAKLLCFLTMLHQEPLIDVDRTDLTQILGAISEQIIKREILLPYTLGRTLYDAAVALFPDEPRELRYEETLELLKGTPIGVFQSGYYTTGPYGLVETAVRRGLAPDLRVPLYHCAEVTCHEVHRTSLSTDHNAPINTARSKHESYLEQLGKSAEWTKFLRDIAGVDRLQYEDRVASVLFFTLGDGMSVDELRLIAGGLTDSVTGFRPKIQALGLPPAKTAFEALGEADLMQLILLAEDKQIVETVDRLVTSRVINVPKGEQREPVINANYTWGAFSLTCRIGTSGASFQSVGADIAPLRLNRLLDSLYPSDDPTLRKELDWLLRRIDGANIESRLDEYFKGTDSVEAITRLILSSKRCVEGACRDLGISPAWFESDAELVDALLWKLGFEAGHPGRPNEAFWDSYRRLVNATSTLDVSAASDDRLIREMSATFFRELEGVLAASLQFTTWALLNDHVRSNRPFSYRYDLGHEFAVERLTQMEHDLDGVDEAASRYSAKWTLEPLIQGFGLLARWLRHTQTDEGRLVRPRLEYPRFEGNTDLRAFPFRHSVPYLDLTEDSRGAILSMLKDTTASLARGRIAKVRNDIVHFRRSGSDVSEINGALAEVRSTIKSLELGGFVPSEFRLARDVGSENGRTLYVMSDGNGREIAFSRPSRFTDLGLPLFSQNQYLFPAALYAHPNEMLRFEPFYESDYSRMWDNFPVRREVAQAPTRAAAIGPQANAES